MNLQVVEEKQDYYRFEDKSKDWCHLDQIRSRKESGQGATAAEAAEAAAGAAGEALAGVARGVA